LPNLDVPEDEENNIWSYFPRSQRFSRNLRSFVDETAATKRKSRVVVAKNCLHRCCCVKNECKCGPNQRAYRDDGCEERCLPMFWDDNGVPPIPIFNWIFDPAEFPSTNPFAVWLGKIGLAYFDRTRKAWMGIINMRVCTYVHNIYKSFPCSIISFVT